MDNVTQALAYLGCIYIGITICLVAAFVALKRTRTPAEQNRDDGMDAAVELVQDRLDATPIHT